jgi:hypothetical protein
MYLSAYSSAPSSRTFAINNNNNHGGEAEEKKEYTLSQILSTPRSVSLFKHSVKPDHADTSGDVISPRNHIYFSDAAKLLPPINRTALNMAKLKDGKIWHLDDLGVVNPNKFYLNSKNSPLQSYRRAKNSHFRPPRRSNQPGSDSEEELEDETKANLIIADVKASVRRVSHSKHNHLLVGASQARSGRGDFMQPMSPLDQIGVYAGGKKLSKAGLKLAELLAQQQFNNPPRKYAEENLIAPYVPVSPHRSPTLSRQPTIKLVADVKEANPASPAFTPRAQQPCNNLSKEKSQKKSHYTHSVTLVIEAALCEWAGAVGKTVEQYRDSINNRLFDAVISYNYWFNGILALARGIYEGRCADSGLRINFQRELHFVEQILSCCREGQLTLIDSNFTANSLEPIFALLSTKITPNNTANQQRLVQSSLFTHFQALNLHGNTLGDSGALKIAQFLANSAEIHGTSQLTALDLSENRLSSAGFTAFFTILGQIGINLRLKHLNLAGSPLISETTQNLGPEITGITAIGGFLAQNSALISLNLANTGLGLLGNSAANALAQGLQRNSALKHLNLAQNYLDHEFLAVLCKNKAFLGLEKLNLNENSLSTAGIYYFCLFLLENQATLVLQHLQIAQNSINLLGLALLSGCLVENNTISTLNLSGNLFSGSPLRAATLFQLNKHSKSPISAQFQSEITDFAAKLGVLGLFVSNSFGNNSTLRVLQLNQCKLGDLAWTFLAKQLSYQKLLVELQLSGNFLQFHGPSGAATADCLLNNRELRCLELSFNELGDKNCVALLNSLENHRNLSSLGLSCCNLGEVSALELLKLVKINSNVRNLDFSGNLCSYGVNLALQSALDSNNKVYRGSKLQRDYEKIAELTENCDYLENLQEEIGAGQEKLIVLNAELAELRSESYKSVEKALTEAVQQQFNTENSSRLSAEAAEYELEREVKRVRTNFEAKIAQLKSQREKEKEMKLSCEKKIEQTKQNISASARDKNLEFDEANRLEILLNNQNRSTENAKNQWEAELKQLQEFISMLENAAAKKSNEEKQAKESTAAPVVVPQPPAAVKKSARKFNSNRNNTNTTLLKPVANSEAEESTIVWSAQRSAPVKPMKSGKINKKSKEPGSTKSVAIPSKQSDTFLTQAVEEDPNNVE